MNPGYTVSIALKGKVNATGGIFFEKEFRASFWGLNSEYCHDVFEFLRGGRQFFPWVFPLRRFASAYPPGLPVCGILMLNQRVAFFFTFFVNPLDFPLWRKG
jgi:hypothetical protein